MCPCCVLRAAAVILGRQQVRADTLGRQSLHTDGEDLVKPRGMARGTPYDGRGVWTGRDGHPLAFRGLHPIYVLLVCF